jgi:hypothetical protein
MTLILCDSLLVLHLQPAEMDRSATFGVKITRHADTGQANIRLVDISTLKVSADCRLTSTPQPRYIC